MKIEHGPFAAWLFAQPPNRTFNYSDHGNCLISQYVKAATGCKIASCTPLMFWIDQDPLTGPTTTSYPVPPWLDGVSFLQDDGGARLLYPLTELRFNLIGTGAWVSFGAVQERYAKLFPESVPAQICPADCVAGTDSGVPPVNVSACGSVAAGLPVNQPQTNTQPEYAQI